MTRINTNIASIIGLNNLQNSQNSLQTSLTRLSTGLKINSGRDDPAGLVASNMLGSQLASINQSITNSNRANDVLSTADAGLSQISGLLDQIRSLVQAGLNTGALSSTETQANQNQIDQALSAINEISANTTFAGDQLIDGSKSYTTQITSADSGKLAATRSTASRSPERRPSRSRPRFRPPRPRVNCSTTSSTAVWPPRPRSKFRVRQGRTSCSSARGAACRTSRPQSMRSRT